MVANTDPSPSSALEWWMLPDADPKRPMTPEQAARFLQLAEQGYPNPARTLLRWVRDGQIQGIHVGKKVAFTLEVLRAYTTRELVPTRGGRR